MAWMAVAKNMASSSNWPSRTNCSRNCSNDRAFVLAKRMPSLFSFVLLSFSRIRLISSFLISCALNTSTICPSNHENSPNTQIMR
mgnify:CR=1 FL=1